MTKSPYPYRDKLGNIIPDDHFENEPGPPSDPREKMSPEARAEYEAMLARHKAEKEKPR